MFNYADAPAQNDFSELIPNGTLAWGLLRIRRYNATAGVVETPSKSSDGQYLDCEITIMDGDWRGRKVWTRIGTQGSEKYVNMGRGAIKAILECGFGANPQNNIAGYELPDYGALDRYGEGVQVGFKIKEEPPQGGYPAKNDVAVFLSPIPDSGTKKDWDRLMAGDTKPSATTRAPVASAAPPVRPEPPAPAWASPAAAPAQAPAQQQMPVAPGQPSPVPQTATPTPAQGPAVGFQPPQTGMAPAQPAAAASVPPTTPTAAPGAPSATSPSNGATAPAPAWLRPGQ